jgi:hypothetical protein
MKINIPTSDKVPKSQYEIDLSQNKAPSIKCIILALTHMHDEEIYTEVKNGLKKSPKTPEEVRKYFYTLEDKGYATELVDTTYDSGRGYEYSKANIKLNELIGERYLSWSRSSIFKGNQSCCSHWYEFFISLNLSDDKTILQIKSANVKVNCCADYGGGEYYKEVLAGTDTENQSISVLDVLKKYPAIIPSLINGYNANIIINSII